MRHRTPRETVQGGQSMTTHFKKLAAAIYHICERASAHPDSLDQIKLNKVLWYADARAYLQRGESITGDTYIKKPFGPVARHNRVAVEQLEAAGALRRGRSASGSGYWNTHFDMTGDYPRESLSDEEAEIIDGVYRFIVEGNLHVHGRERTDARRNLAARRK